MADDDVSVLLARLKANTSLPDRPTKQQSLSQKSTDTRPSPGPRYFLVGNSYNMDYRLLGTEMEARRRACITLLFESGSNHNRCVRLRDAYEFEGFIEILGQAEQDWLAQLPQDTYIGPAVDQVGRKIPAAFAVWQKMEQSDFEPVLIIARG